MAESNTPPDSLHLLAQKAIEYQTVVIQSKNIIITVHDDKDQVEGFQSIAAEDPDTLYVFDNGDACYNFISEKVSSDPHVDIIVFIGGGLVCNLIPDIHFVEQVKKILINLHSVKQNENQ
jgi:hypothetical protein